MAITRYELPSVDELRTQYCNDVRRGKQKYGVARPNVAAGSETYVRGEALASLVFELHAKNSALQDATQDDSATGDDLQRLCDNAGVVVSHGAGATGYVIADCIGAVVYPAGQELTTQDGLRYGVTVSTAATAGAQIPVAGVDVGKRTSRADGTSLTWTSPPAGSNTTALVGPGGLTGGTDADTDATKRRKLRDKRRNGGKSGNWSHYRQWASEVDGVEAAFVYPALRGPSTVDVAVTIPADRDNFAGAYTRAATVALSGQVAVHVVASDPEHADVAVTAVADQSTDVVLRVTLPAAVNDGGSGGGWSDPTASRWPTAQSTPYATSLSGAPTSPLVLRVECLSSGNAPINDAHFAVWSSASKCFSHTRVRSATLVSGTLYEITLWDAVDTSVLASGDYVSPDADRLDDYGSAIAASFGGLGPGEKADPVGTYALSLPRCARRPLPSVEWPSTWNSSHVGQITTEHPEVTHVAVLTPALPITPAVGSVVPSILVLGKLAVYPV